MGAASTPLRSPLRKWDASGTASARPEKADAALRWKGLLRSCKPAHILPNVVTKKPTQFHFSPPYKRRGRFVLTKPSVYRWRIFFCTPILFSRTPDLGISPLRLGIFF